MKNKLYLTVAFFLVAVFFLLAGGSDAFALGGSCDSSKGRCKQSCAGDEKHAAFYDDSDCGNGSGEICCVPKGDCFIKGGTCNDSCGVGTVSMGSGFVECKGVFGKQQCCKIALSGAVNPLKDQGSYCGSNAECDVNSGLICTGIFVKTCEPGTTQSATNNNSTNTSNNNAPAPVSSNTAPSIPVTGGWDIEDISGFGLPEASVTNITGNLLNWLLGILATVGVIGFVISGILYLVSTGDETMIERAKNAMKWSIVGVIVGLSGVIIIQAVDWALNGFGGF